MVFSNIMRLNQAAMRQRCAFLDFELYEAGSLEKQESFWHSRMVGYVKDGETAEILGVLFEYRAHRESKVVHDDEHWDVWEHERNLANPH